MVMDNARAKAIYALGMFCIESFYFVCPKQSVALILLLLFLITVHRTMDNKAWLSNIYT